MPRSSHPRDEGEFADSAAQAGDIVLLKGPDSTFGDIAAVEMWRR